jgi:tRNA(fMet)-specific endonuclease VapC
MAGRFLLDTNILVAALGGDSDVVNRIDDADQCFISTIVLGEILYGALNSSNPDSNLKNLATFTLKTGFLPCNEETARLYGDIKTALRQKGKPIPDNDIWIAASAQQHTLALATRDAHFTEVDDLEQTNW